MPGLQSIVSAWTKINNDHVQYFENGPGGRPQQLLRPGQHPGQPPQLVGPNGLPLVNGPGGAPMEQQGGGGGAVVAGAVDPRTTTYAPSPAGLSHHSGSSLSSVSFSKNGMIQGQGSATTVGTTTTPMSSTQSLLGNAPPSQRYPLYNHGQSMTSSQGSLPQHIQPQQGYQPTASGQRSPLHRPSRRANHHHHHHGHHHHYNGGLQRQLESYGGNPDAAMPPPPPQAGADAILGRRKNNAGIDRSDSPGNLGEPPASLSSNAAIPPGATNPMARGASALSRSPSSSLWHSQRKSSNLSVGSSDNSAGGAASVTASLDKMNISSLRNGHGPGMQHLSRQQNEAAIAELNKTAETALQNMQNLGGNGSTPPQSNVASHQGNTLGGGNSSSSQTSSVVVPLPQQQQTSTIPIPPQARPGASRRRIRKSHSRTDLVREMALDKPRGSHGARKRSSTITSASSQATPKIHNRADSDLDLSSSMGSQVARQMLGAGGVGAGAGQPKQGQRRSQDFLSRTATIDESEPSHMSSSADSSSHGGKQQRQQQQQQGGIGEAIRISVPTALNDGRHRPYSQLADRQHPYDRIGELADPLDRHSAAAPGGQWMQGMFPSNQHLPARRRESSSGSSGTAITGNRSMALSSALSKVSGEGMGNIEEQAAYEQMQQPAPSTAAAAVVAGAAAAAGATNDGTLPSKQQMGMDPPLQGDPNCERCARMEATLLSLQADLEYMRTLELQREFHCKQCETGSVHPGNARLDRLDSNLPSIDQKVRYRHQSSDRSVSSAVSIGSRGSRTSSRMHRRASVKSAITSARTVQTAGRSMGSRTTMFLRDASRRLADLSTRNKRQVKQTTHERAYWQNDMHLKLEKFAMMCKNLNEEAAHRSNEVKETKALLDKMTAERNALVSHVDTLKARVELYESNNVEQSKQRGDWEAEKSVLMERIDAAGKNQEAAIADLSNRLELAVETIDSERKQQRMRRQIIFPQSGDGSAPSSPHISPHEPSKGDDMERIQKTKEVARKAQQSLEAVMVQSAEREKAMQARLDALERELAEAKATALGFESTVHVPLAMEGRASIRRSSSSTSLASVGGL